MVDFKTLPYAKITKLVFTGLLLVFVWLVLFFYTGQALSAGLYQTWFIPAAIAATAIPVTALAAIVFGPVAYFILTIAVSFALLGFFPLNLYALLGVTLMFFGFWRAYHRAQFELHNNIKFAASHIVRNVSSIILLTFLMMVSFQLYAKISSDIAVDETSFFGRLADSVTRGVLPIVERQIPGFEPDMGLDQYIVNSFQTSLPNFDSLPLETKQDQIAQSRLQLADSLQISVTGQEPLSEVARLAVAAQIEAIVNSFDQRGLPLPALLPAIYALAIFSLLRIISYFVGLVAQIVGLSLFWILRASHFFHIVNAQILAERVVLQVPINKSQNL